MAHHVITRLGISIILWAGFAAPVNGPAYATPVSQSETPPQAQAEPQGHELPLNLAQRSRRILPQDREDARARSSRVAPVRDAQTGAPADPPQRVIVQLETPPLAEYVANLRQLSQNVAEKYASETNQRLDVNTAASLNYRAALGRDQQAILDAIGKQNGAKVAPTHRYDVAFNGFALELPASQLEAVRAMPGVKAIYPDRILRKTLDTSLSVIGAPSVWANISATLGITRAGQGVKVAVLDTGIDNAHPFFANDGSFAYPSGYPKGYCAATSGFCNGKIIAARYYAQSSTVNISETLTPLDADGHGTHVSGIAAGNLNTVASLDGASITATVSGVAPFAYLMAYKVLWLMPDGSGSGETSGILSGINDAVADGADVMNLSLGSGTRSGDPQSDPLNQAAVNGANVGVVVAWAAGNDGPSDNTVQDEGGDPKIISVAASSTGRAWTADAQIGSLSFSVPPTMTSVRGESVGAGTVVSAPYVDVGNVVAALPAGSLTGKIAIITRGVIARVQKTQYAKDAGAIGAILRNDWADSTAPDDLEMDAHVIPTIHIKKADAANLTNYLNSLGALTSTIRITLTPSVKNLIFAPVDEVADFSSRGLLSNINLIKPDVTAPGVGILSSVRAVLEPGKQWDLYGGTSMASPHVAGSAALLLSARADWKAIGTYGRVMRIKSALMNTSVTALTDAGSAATVSDMGAGRIALVNAADPGVVFDPPSHSFGVVYQGGSKVFTVTNVSSAPLTYTFSYSPEVAAAYTLSAQPSTLVVPAGGAVTFTLVLAAAGLADGDYAGQMYWNAAGSQQSMHLPYFFRKQPEPLSKSVAPNPVLQWQEVTYTLVISNDTFNALTYALTDVLPVGAQYVAGSVTGGGTYNAGLNAILASGTIAAPVQASYYEFLDNLDEPALASYSPFGGYTELLAPGDVPTALGDDATDLSAYLGCNQDLYGTTSGFAEDLRVSSNGVFFPRDVSTSLQTSSVSHTMPTAANPDGLLAAYWDDLMLSPTALITPSGVSYANTDDATQCAALGDNVAYIAQIDNAYRKANTSQRLTYQLQHDGLYGDEYWVLYNSVSGTLTTGSVGIENANGSLGTQYSYAGSPTTRTIESGRVILWYRPYISQPPITITFRAVITTPGPVLTNTVAYRTSDSSQEMTASASVAITPAVQPTPTPTPIFTPTPTPGACVAAGTGVVISEFRTRGPSGGSDEFIELLNTSNASVNIGGWKVNGSSSGGVIGTRATISAGVVLAPGQHYLLTNSAGYGGATAGEQTYSTGIADNGGIGLLNASSTVIDQVGMISTSAYKEGTTLTPMSGTANQSYERYTQGTQDTGNNSTDFALNAATSNPQNMASGAVNICVPATSTPTPTFTPTPTPTPTATPVPHRIYIPNTMRNVSSSW